jgi:hypothetical protein
MNLKPLISFAKAIPAQVTLLVFGPVQPKVPTYDEVIKELNQLRSRANLPRVEEYRAPEKPFIPRPAPSTQSADIHVVSDSPLELEPPADFMADQPVYRP